MRYFLIAILSLSVFVSIAQTGLVSGELNVTVIPTDNGNGTFTLSGTFTDPKGLYFAGDVAAEMSLWKGNNYFAITAASANGATLTLTVDDTYSTGFMGTGTYSISEETTNLKLPGVSTTGDSNPALSTPPDYAAKMNFILKLIDEAIGNAANKNGMFSSENTDSLWLAIKYRIDRRVEGHLSDKGEFVLQDSSGGTFRDIFRVEGGSGGGPATISIGNGTDMPFLQVEGGVNNPGSIKAGDGNATYNLPVQNPAGAGLPAGNYLQVVDENGNLINDGWLSQSSMSGDGNGIYSGSDTLTTPVTVTTSAGNPLTFKPTTGDWEFKIGDDGYPQLLLQSLDGDDQVDITKTGISAVSDANGNYNATNVTPAGVDNFVNSGSSSYGFDQRFGKLSLFNYNTGDVNAFTVDPSFKIERESKFGILDENKMASILLYSNRLDSLGANYINIGDQFFDIGGNYFSDSFRGAAGIRGIAEQTLSGTSNRGSSLSLYSTPIGTADPIDRVIVKENGVVDYTADVSSNYTDRSLVDKGYLDQFQLYRGVTAYESNQDGFNEVGVLINRGDNEHFIGTSIDESYNSIRSYDTGDERVSRITTSPGLISLYTKGTSTTDFSGVNVRPQGVELIRGAGNPSFQGFYYSDDYSADYTNRSLVDKEYVDTRTILKNANTTVTGQVEVSDGIVELSSSNSSTFGTMSFKMDNSTGTQTMIADGAISRGFAGITYPRDYSANYNDRSLVDKAYVDNLVNEYITISIPCFSSSETVTTGESNFWTVPDHLIGGSIVEVQYIFRTAGSGGTVDVQMSNGFTGFFGTTIADGDRVQTSNNSGSPLALTSEQIIYPLVASIGATTPPDGLTVNLKILLP